MTMNAIKTQMGLSVGEWDGQDVEVLQAELDRIRAQNSLGTGDKLVVGGIPHRDQLPDDLQNFRAYPIWACDKANNCLCGARANRIVSVADVRQYSMIDHH
ncbi:MAG: hypothetical protein KTR18_08265 [Acidiferrobacterales bacterium]|nr:hypothetical protein [Acidiferrobacterales bacterium]